MKLLKIVLAIILMTSLAIGLVAGCADNSETTTTTEQTSGEQIDSKKLIIVILQMILYPTTIVWL